MKRFTKWCLISAFILVIIGVILVGTAAVKGFSWISLKEGQRAGTFQVGPFDVSVTGPFGVRVGVHQEQEYSGKGTDLKSYTFDKNEIKELKLDVGAGDVEIREGSNLDDTITVAVDTRYADYDVVQNQNTLTIEKGSFKVNIGLSNRHYGPDVLITVPKDIYFETMDFSVGAGDLTVQAAMMADICSLRTGAGDLEYTGDLTVNKSAEFTVNSGDITLDELLCAGSLNASCGAGDFDISGTVQGDLNASCGVGDMSIELLGEPDQYNYVLSCGAGDLTVNGNSYTSLKHELNLKNNDNLPDIYLDCGAGDLYFRLD
ncbi:Uncharacterised protein [uncultured Roseburia sp.]|uniref:DUF4097 domain-containing protein n=1 Tax=Brotonthovivens ammoniilytica TaxID=2981725 RepID=A0ABT2TLI8_9FIRM|nr:DUF4097 family beta strand repeat-containing protein [Brotonthovivens ammoniilytica]MCU6763075.1 DUF4097 domain-containing protein [Brotonthovivens ammoniilytica]SCJ02437.1 Uncharacterised protein [uncultured Roseburia sp.]